jgi:hypothetical protein
VDKQLKPEQIETVRKITEMYINDLKTKGWQESIKVHNDHREVFTPMFSRDALEKMTEIEFKNLYKQTWASEIWENKDWNLENAILKPNNGFENVRKGLVELLYGNDNIEVRLDNFRDNVKGIGFSTISEILNFVFPDQYCLFNKKTKLGLQYMNIDILPKKYLKYGINTGKEYLECLETLTAIKNEIAKDGFQNPNYIDLDAFFWYIFDRRPPIIQTSIKVSTLENGVYYDADFRSTESSEVGSPKSQEDVEKSKKIQAELARIGEFWGFKIWIPIPDRERVKKFWTPREGTLLEELPGSYSGERLKIVKFIDVLWVDKNNTSINRAFEVEATTAVYSGLLRMSDLLKMYSDYNVKIYIVAPQERKDKVFAELMRPTFEHLRSVCMYTSFENVLELGKDKYLKYLKPEILDDTLSESLSRYTG